jgi:phosphoribosylformimino-5-aminoimidazole carboxamide ribotide isomerase
MGIDRLIIGTRALDSPEWLFELCSEFPGKIAVGIDAENGRVAVKDGRPFRTVRPLILHGK